MPRSTQAQKVGPMSMAGNTAGTTMKAVPRLERERFLGRWHEIARLPNRFQRDHDRLIMIDYVALPGEQILAKTLYSRGEGELGEHQHLIERRYPIEDPGQFRLRTGPAWLGFLSIAWSAYWVLAVDRDYQWMMIGEPEKKWLWILARERTLDRGILETLKTKARGMGYDLAPLIISGELRTFQPL